MIEEKLDRIEELLESLIPNPIPKQIIINPSTNTGNIIWPYMDGITTTTGRDYE